MNWKLTTYIASITLFSYLSFFAGATGIFIVISLLTLYLISYFYHNFYNLFLEYPKYKISKGLFYSSIIGMIFLIPFAIGDFSYQIDNIGDIDLLLPVGVVIYILSMIICFVVDSYYNPKIKGVKKIKIAIGAFLFYFILYFVNVFLSLFIGMMHMFANWG